MKAQIATGSAADCRADGIIVGIMAGAASLAGPAAAIDRATGGMLARAAGAPEFKADAGRTAILRPARGKHACVIAVGLGAGSPREYARACAAGFAAAAAAKLATVACALPAAAGIAPAAPAALRLAAEHAARACYSFRLGTKPGSTSLRNALLIAGGRTGAAHSRAIRQGLAIGEGSNLARHLAEQPPNICTPEYLARAAARMARAEGIKIRVLKEAELERSKMGGILAVGRGSSHPPRLIVMTYSGGRRGAAPVALVGKGVTFDTGGISLKPGAAMDEMKFDMCGAAGMIGTILAASRMKLPINVTAIVPTVENMPDGKSFRPGDVITMLDGQTVEILNTDAEGRLILADALAYAAKLKPAVIVDAATLTGACVIALGNHRTGMFARSDKLADALHEAGELAADPCWRLPLDSEYDRMLRSDYADVPNIGGGRAAGTITAACFLGRFVKMAEWSHLDIAGTGWGKDKRATGRPVALLATWLAQRARKLA